MMKRPVRLVLLLGLVLAPLHVSAVAQAGSGRDPCLAPDDAAGAVAALPKVAAVLKPGETLKVLGIGSATMFGPDASLSPGTLTSQAVVPNATPITPAQKVITQEPSDKAFTKQMGKALQAAVPGLNVEITIRGGKGLTATEMLPMLRKELEGNHYQLVLWQTGTVEAVRNSPPGEFAQTLVNGAEAVEAAGANLVLVDSQYSRFLQTNSNLDPYTQALQQTAAMPGVMLFHRFDLMRGWASEGQIDLERTPKNDRKRVADVLHACIGAHLARSVLAGARS